MTTYNIVGKGPSLLDLTAHDFAPGPVIALNQSILQVRRIIAAAPWHEGLLRDAIYTMQKDGCEPHAGTDFTPSRQRCYEPSCYASAMVEPMPPEILLTTTAESPHCWDRYTPRMVIDVEKDLSLPWTTPSAPVAVSWAISEGATALRMLAFDSYTTGDRRRVEFAPTKFPSMFGGNDNDTLTLTYLVEDDTANGYHAAAVHADRIAAAKGIDIEWVNPHH